MEPTGERSDEDVLIGKHGLIWVATMEPTGERSDEMRLLGRHHRTPRRRNGADRRTVG
jgi:hypothetical protein